MKLGQTGCLGMPINPREASRIVNAYDWSELQSASEKSVGLENINKN